MIEQAKLAYFPLGKVFEKQIKTIEEESKNQIKRLKIMENNSLNLMKRFYYRQR